MFQQVEHITKFKELIESEGYHFGQIGQIGQTATLLLC